MAKRIFGIAVLVAFILGVCMSCNRKDNIFKVGILMESYEIDRWEKDKNLLVQEIEKLGGTVMVDVANGDDKLQIQQAIQMIKSGANVLIVVPVNVETSAAIVQAAHKNKVKVIAYDRLIRNCELDFYISFDNVKVGILQAEYLTRQCQGGYVLLNGPVSDNNSFLLRIGQLSILQPMIDKGQAILLYDAYMDAWKEEEAYYHMKECLERYGDTIKAVIAGNDALARGAIRVALENDSLLKNQICFAGQDADLASCKSIIKGIQTMTVYKPIMKTALTAAIIAKKLAANEKIFADTITSVNNNAKMVPTILIAPVAVDKNNIQEIVVKDAFIQAEDLSNSSGGI